MSSFKNKSIFSSGILILSLVLISSSLWAQVTTEKKIQFKFTPSSMNLVIGEIKSVKIELVDENGVVQNIPFTLVVSGATRAARSAIDIVTRGSESGGVLETQLKAVNAGSFMLSARFARQVVDPGVELVSTAMPLEVAFPPLERITFVNPPENVYEGTNLNYLTEVYDAADMIRNEINVRLSSSNSSIASIDNYGNFTARSTGTVTLTARAENITSTLSVRIVENPVVRVELTSDMIEARTGDVFHFSATAQNSSGQAVFDAPIEYTFTGKAPKTIAPRSGEIATPAGEIRQDGRFVAETPGLYTINATSGPFSSRITVAIEARNLNQRIEFVGHGEVFDVFTSDLWVWEGVDGRDYAITGTWGSNGEAYFWDITDPTKIEKIDVVQVDARTVNDVKVSEDGRIAVISREGASNRRNGIVILDVSNPRDVKILSEYDDELTGGVHNVFIFDNHVYAVNNGTRYDIINIEDPTKPYRVSRFQLDGPGRTSIHDVWVQDGIAYSSNWNNGVQLVDVGGGEEFRKEFEARSPEFNLPMQLAGSPSNPVPFANFKYPSGWNHAAFPFKSQSTDRFYVLAGDESISFLGIRQDPPAPSTTAGWIHFADMTDPMNPEEVAKYAVPEAGSHNFWVDNDILYAAFYEGGFRVVDVSGELMGDLYRQGREIGYFTPQHAEASVPNAPMVWGPMPFKGNIFFSDLHSGLWAVRIVSRN